MLKSFKLKKTLVSEKKLSLLKNIIGVILFSVLTGLSANLKFEIGTIPLTAQTLIVLLSGLFLGKKKGAISQITYLTAGITGLPWFSRGGGLSYILSPTFGYLLGFVPAAYLVGYLTEEKKDLIKTLFSFLISHLLIYFFGILWLSKSLGFEKSLIVGIYPFLLGDSIKVVIASLISKFKK